MTLIEKYYGNTLRILLYLINPFKKIIIKTECEVHKFIIEKGLNILNHNNYIREYNFLNMYINQLKNGATWADQDFKSIGHFYNPQKKRGLYGNTNAFNLAQKYYSKAIEYWNKNDISKSIFFLGAFVHLIQDMTIPQHVNISLLDNHHQYENYVKIAYQTVKEFTTLEKPVIFEDLEHYVRFNTKVALKIYKRFKKIKNDNERFYRITRCSLPLAQRTTAGCFLMFLKEVGMFAH